MRLISPDWREMEADLLTPVAAFLRIARGARQPFLLESVEGGEAIARYSFLGRDPTTLVRSTVDGRLSGGDPLRALRRTMSGNRPVRLGDLPRFTGGAVGYLSYDVVRLLERLPRSIEDDLRLPDVLFGIYDTVLAFDHLKQRIQIVSNVMTEDAGRRVPARALRGRYDAARRRIEAIERLLQRPAASRARRRARRGRWSSNITESRYEENVKRAKD